MDCLLKVNGEEYDVRVSPWTTLADALRDEMALTGTRTGCREGECGSCTVLVDGAPLRACLTLALQVEGREVATVEGYADDPLGRRLQQAFVEHHAAQCGFCTSGMLAVARCYLEDDSIADHRDAASIRAALDAVVCRCTGYQPIVVAVASVAGDRKAA